MGLRNRSNFPSGTFYVTTSTLDRNIYFTDNSDFEMIERNIEFYRARDKATIFGYVVMSNHLHMIVDIPQGNSISNFMRDFKRMTAKEFYGIRNMKSGHLWQDRFDDLCLISKEVALTKLNYIHQNPVRAGLVEKAEDWIYSSARCYLYNEKRIITVTGIEP